MAEEYMTLIGTEVQGPMSLKLLFTVNISKLPVNVQKTSQIFKILNIAEIYFKLTDFRYGQPLDLFFIAAKKISHISVNGLTITLNIICAEPKCDIILLCSENWSAWKELGVYQSNGHIQIVVNTIVDIGIQFETLIKLYDDDEFTDFQLSTVEGSVTVHKACLAANSEVFKTMLRREWKETTEGRIQMEGVNLQTLKDLKNYMYLGTLPDDGLCQLLQFAMYYMMDNLKAECVMKLAQTAKAESLFDILEYSIFNKIPELTFAILTEVPKKNNELAGAYYQEIIKNQKKNSSDDNNEE